LFNTDWLRRTERAASGRFDCAEQKPDILIYFVIYAEGQKGEGAQEVQSGLSG